VHASSNFEGKNRFLAAGKASKEFTQKGSSALTHTCEQKDTVCCRNEGS